MAMLEIYGKDTNAIAVQTNVKKVRDSPGKEKSAQD